MKRRLAIPAAIVIGGLIVAVAVYFSVEPQSVKDPSLVRPVSQADHILGNPTAPVKIIVYSDFDCAYCKSFDSTLRQIIANEGARGDVALVFRHFPLIEIHPNAIVLAKAAECAAEAGGNEAFWRFTEALYANQPVSPSELGTIASLAAVPDSGKTPEQNAFATCYASESATKPLMERILRDRQNALDMGAQGTPYTVILTPGSTPIELNGAYPYDAIKQVVDQALGK